MGIIFEYILTTSGTLGLGLLQDLLRWLEYGLDPMDGSRVVQFEPELAVD